MRNELRSRRAVLGFLRRSKALGIGRGWIVQKAIEKDCYPQWMALQTLQFFLERGIAERREVMGSVHWRVTEKGNREWRPLLTLIRKEAKTKAQERFAVIAVHAERELAELDEAAR